MFLGEGVFGLLLLFLWGYCIFDVIRTERSAVQYLPKMLWLLLVIFIPTIGSLAWLLLGRPRGASFKVPTSLRREPSHPSSRSTPPPEAPKPRVENYEAKREEALRRYQEERERERQREDEIRRRRTEPDDSSG